MRLSRHVALAAILCVYWLAASVYAVTISNVSLSSTSIAQYSKLEVTFNVSTSASKLYYPYVSSSDGYADPAGITVDATVTLPNSTSVTVPAFYYEPYQRVTDGSGNEVLGINGSPCWKVRYAPSTTGSYSVRITATDASGSTTSSSYSFTCTSSSNKGFLRKASDPRFMVFDNGSSFVPISEGRQWFPNSNRPTLGYADTFATDHSNGINMTRIWDQNDSFNLALEGSYRRWDPQWSQYSNGVSIDTSTKRSGNRAVKFYRSSSGTDGYFQRVAVNPSTSYTLTGYIKTSGLSGNAFITAGASAGNNPGSTKRTNTVTGTVNWTQVSCTFTTGSSETIVGIWAGCENASGTAWFDDLSLIPSGQSYNAISDPGFERQFPKDDQNNNPGDPTINLTVPKGTYINQWAGYQLDKIIEAAETNGIYIQLCSHGDVYWTWDAVIYNESWASNNGYYVSMNDSRHIGYWKRNYRYRIARWGYSPAVMAWEVWNEHGNIGSADSAWTFYNTFGQWAHSADPFRHLFTTSMGSQCYSQDFWANNGAPMDLANYHDYITTGIAGRHPTSWDQDETLFVYASTTTALLNGWPGGSARKPYIWGEVGILVDWSTNNTTASTGTGGLISRHNMLWAGLMSPIFTSPIDFDHADKYQATKAAAAFFSGESYHTKNYNSYATSELSPLSGYTITATNSNLHVLLAACPDRILGWVHNKQNTWYNVAQLGNTPSAQTGSFTTPSLNAGSYRIEWWDTYAGTLSSQTTVSHGGGSMTVNLPAGGIQKDMAVKIINTGASVPNAPSNLTATAASSSQINLSWTDNSSNETGFKIERKTGSGGTYSQIGTVGANATTYPDSGLSASTTYYYRVRATNGSGDSAYSNEANATTLPGGGGSYALSYNGTSAYAAVNDAAALDISGSAMTLEAWVKVNALPGSGSAGTIAARELDGSSGYALLVTPSGAVEVRLGTSGNTWGDVVSSNQTWTSGTWYHVAMSYDGSTVRIFRDGTLIGSGSQTGTLLAGTRKLYFGGGRYEWSLQHYLNGVVDEARLSKVCRYTSNFTKPSSAFTNDSNTVGLWHFDENTGSTSADSSGNSLTANITSATWTTGWGGAAPTAYALSYNGTSAYAAVNDAAALDISGSAMTMEAWVKVNGLPGSGSAGTIMARELDGSSGYALLLTPSGAVEVRLGTSGNTWGDVVSSNQTWTSGQWYHVAFSYDGSTIRIFRDGTQIGSGSQSGTLLAGTRKLYFGGYRYEWSPQHYFNGAIDEARLSKVCRYTSNFTAPTSAFSNDSNTVGLWHFSENTGSTSADSSGNGLTATVSGATWTTGKF